MIAMLLRIIGLFSVVINALNDNTNRLKKIQASQDRIEAQQQKTLDAIFAALESEVVEIRFNVLIDGQITQGVTTLTITDSQKFTVSLDARDAKGNPASFDGKPTFAVDRTDLLTVTPSADGMTAEVAAVGPLGSAQVTATVDAAIGANVVPIIGTLTVDVVGGQATVVALNATAPVEQTAHSGSSATSGWLRQSSRARLPLSLQGAGALRNRSN
jgi:hypothetical protein